MDHQLGALAMVYGLWTMVLFCAVDFGLHAFAEKAMAHAVDCGLFPTAAFIENTPLRK